MFHCWFANIATYNLHTIRCVVAFAYNYKTMIIMIIPQHPYVWRRIRCHIFCLPMTWSVHGSFSKWLEVVLFVFISVFFRFHFVYKFEISWTENEPAFIPLLQPSTGLGWPQRSPTTRLRSADFFSCSFFNSSAAFLRSKIWFRIKWFQFELNFI